MSGAKFVAPTTKKSRCESCYVHKKGGKHTDENRSN